MNIWFRPAWRYLTKTVVLMVAFCFLFPFLIWAFEPANFQNPQALKLGTGPLEIPEQLGSIMESRPGQSPVIVHVRDLHCNYEVQSRIQGIIDYLAEHHGLRLVAIEGAGQPVNVTKLSSFPDQKLKAAVGDQFARQGKISGAELYAATGKYPVELVGIEHPGRYAEEAASVQRFLTDENQGWIYDLREALNYTKASVYGPRLLKFDAHRQAYQTGEVLPLTFASTLVREARSQKYDLTTYPQLKRYVSRRLQVLPIQVDSDALLEEMDALELQLRARLIRTPEERELSGLEQRVDLMEKLINISASPEELARYREAPEKYRAREVLRYLQRQGEADALGLDAEVLQLDQALSEVHTFYQLADLRSQDFVHNLSGLLETREADIALLVTGGYHSREILAALRKQNLGYVSVKPRLTQLDQVNPYFSLLKKQATPLEKLLAQNQRLMALAPFFAQGADRAAILDEAILPADIRIGYLVLDMTLKLRWLNQRIQRGLPDMAALRLDYARLIDEYRANNPQVDLALEDIRINQDGLLVSFRGSPVFALIYPDHKERRLPGLPLHRTLLNGYVVSFYDQSEYTSVAKLFPDSLESARQASPGWRERAQSFAAGLRPGLSQFARQNARAQETVALLWGALRARFKSIPWAWGALAVAVGLAFFLPADSEPLVSAIGPFAMFGMVSDPGNPFARFRRPFPKTWLREEALSAAVAELVGEGYEVTGKEWKKHNRVVEIQLSQGAETRVVFAKYQAFRTMDLGLKVQELVGLPRFRMTEFGAGHALMSDAGLPNFEAGPLVRQLVNAAGQLPEREEVLNTFFNQLSYQIGLVTASEVVLAYEDGSSDNIVLNDFRAFVPIVNSRDYYAGFRRLATLVRQGVRLTHIDFENDMLLADDAVAFDTQRFQEIKHGTFSMYSQFGDWVDPELVKAGFNAGMIAARSQLSQISDLLSDYPDLVGDVPKVMQALKMRLLPSRHNAWYDALTDGTRLARIADREPPGGKQKGASTLTFVIFLGGLVLAATGLAQAAIAGVTLASGGLAAAGLVLAIGVLATFPTARLRLSAAARRFLVPAGVLHWLAESLWPGLRGWGHQAFAAIQQYSRNLRVSPGRSVVLLAAVVTGIVLSVWFWPQWSLSLENGMILSGLTLGIAGTAPPRRSLFFRAGLTAPGDAESHRRTYGAKAANLIEMLLLGLPVPPGFALPAKISLKKNLRRQVDLIRDEVSDNLNQLENETGQAFGDASNPLLVSVRSGAVSSMPGMLLTLTNVGLNDQTVEGLATRTGNRAYALATYAEYIADYALHSLAVSGEDAEYFRQEREILVRARVEGLLSEAEYDERIARFQGRLQSLGLVFPQDAREQLDQSLRAVMASWESLQARQYRQRYGVEDLGTGVIVQQMVGHGIRASGSGVLTSRDLMTGLPQLSGEFGFNLPGTAVVGGQVLPGSLDALRIAQPVAYRQLTEYVARLEQHFQGDIQDVEFTLENGQIYFLQTRNAEGIIYPEARVRSLRDAIQAGLKEEQDVVNQLSEADLQWMEDALLAPRVPEGAAGLIGTGRPAAPGLRSGVVALSLDAAREFMSQGLPVILVRDRSGFEDETVLAQDLCVGVIERVGAVFSHASGIFRAQRQMKPCVLGVEGMSLQTVRAPAALIIGDTRIEEGRPVTVDGATGRIFSGESVYTEPSQTKQALAGDYGARTSEEYHLYQTVQRWHQRIKDRAWQEKQRLSELHFSLTMTKLPDAFGSLDQSRVSEVMRWLGDHRPDLLTDAYRPVLLVMSLMKSFPDRIPEFKFRYDTAAISAMGFVGMVLSGLRSTENRALFFSLMREFEPNLLRRLLYNPYMYHHMITPAFIHMGRQAPAELAAILDEYAINTGSLNYSERDNYQGTMEFLFSRPLAQLNQDEAAAVLDRVNGNTLAYLASDWLAGIEANLEKIEYLAEPDVGALFNRVLSEWEAETPEKVGLFWQVVRETDELQAAPWPYRKREAWLSNHLRTQGVILRPAVSDGFSSQRAKIRAMEQEIGQLLKEMRAGYDIERMLTALRERYQVPQWIASTGRQDLAPQAEQYSRLISQLRNTLTRAVDKPLYRQAVILANLLILSEFETRFGTDADLLWEMQEAFLRTLPENEAEVATLRERHPAIPAPDLALLSWAVGDDTFYLDVLRQHLYEDLKLEVGALSPLWQYLSRAARRGIGFLERGYVFNHMFLLLSNGWISQTRVKWDQTQEMLEWVSQIDQTQESIQRTGQLDGEDTFQGSLNRGLQQLGADVTRIEQVRFTRELVAEISVRAPEGLRFFYLKRDVYPATVFGNNLQAMAGVEGVRVAPVLGQHALQQDAGVIVRDSQAWLMALDQQADQIPGARVTLDAFFQQLSYQAGRLLASQVLMNLSDSHDRNMVIRGVRSIAASVQQGDYPAAFQAMSDLVERQAVRLTNIDFNQGLMLTDVSPNYLRQNARYLGFNLGRWFDQERVREGFRAGMADAWGRIPTIHRMLRAQRDLGLSLPGAALEELRRRIQPGREDVWLEFIFGTAEEMVEPEGQPRIRTARDYRWIDPAELNPVLEKMAGPDFRLEQLHWRGVHVAEITVTTALGHSQVYFIKENALRETQLGNDLQQLVGLPGFAVEQVGRRHALMSRAGVPVWWAGLALGQMIQHAQTTGNARQLATLDKCLRQLNEQAGRLMASHVMMAYTDGHDENLVILGFQRIVALVRSGEYDAALDLLEVLVDSTGIQFSSVDFSPTRMLGSKIHSDHVKKSGETLTKTFRPWLNLDLWRTGYHAGLAEARRQIPRIRERIIADDPRTETTFASVTERISEQNEDQWFTVLTEYTNREQDERGFKQIADAARRTGPSAGFTLLSMTFTLTGLSLLGVGLGPWLIIPGAALTGVSLGIAAVGAAFLGLATWPLWASFWIRYRWLPKAELQAAIARLGGGGFTIQRLRWVKGSVAEIHLARGAERRIMYAKQFAYPVTALLNQLQELAGQPAVSLERFGRDHVLMSDAGVSLDTAARSIAELSRAAAGDPLRQNVMSEFFRQLSYQGGVLLSQHVLIGFEDGHENNILLRNYRAVHALVRQGRLEAAFTELADLLEQETLGLSTLDVEPDHWVFRDMPAMQPDFALCLEALRHFFSDQIDETQVAAGFRDTQKTLRARSARLEGVLQRAVPSLGFYRATPQAFLARIAEKFETKNLNYLLATARSLRPWRGRFLPLGIRGSIGDEGERPEKVRDDLHATMRSTLLARFQGQRTGRLGDSLIQLANLKSPGQTIWLQRLDDQTRRIGLMNYSFFDHRPGPDERITNGMTLAVNTFGEIDLQVITTTRLNERLGGGVGATVVNFLREEAQQRNLTLRYTNVKGPALRVLIGRYTERIYATQEAGGYQTKRAEPWNLQSAAWGKLVGVEEPEGLSLEDLIEDALAGMEDRKVGYNFIGRPKSTTDVVEDQLEDSRVLAKTVRARLAIDKTDLNLAQRADQLGARMALMAWDQTRDSRLVALARVLADLEIYLTVEEKTDPKQLASYFEGLEYIVYPADVSVLSEALARRAAPDNRLASVLELSLRSPLGRGPGSQAGFSLLEVMTGLSLISLLILVGLVIGGTIPATLGQADRLMILGGWLAGGLGLPLLAGIGFSGTRNKAAEDISEVDRVIEERRAQAVNDPEAEYNQSVPIVGINLNKPSLDFFAPPFNRDEPLSAYAFVELTRLLNERIRLNVLDYVAITFDDEPGFVRDYILDAASKRPKLVLETMPRLGFHWQRKADRSFMLQVLITALSKIPAEEIPATLERLAEAWKVIGWTPAVREQLPTRLGEAVEPQGKAETYGVTTWGALWDPGNESSLSQFFGNLAKNSEWINRITWPDEAPAGIWPRLRARIARLGTHPVMHATAREGGRALLTLLVLIPPVLLFTAAGTLGIVTGVWIGLPVIFAAAGGVTLLVAFFYAIYLPFRARQRALRPPESEEAASARRVRPQVFLTTFIALAFSIGAIGLAISTGTWLGPAAVFAALAFVAFGGGVWFFVFPANRPAPKIVSSQGPDKSTQTGKKDPVITSARKPTGGTDRESGFIRQETLGFLAGLSGVAIFILGVVALAASGPAVLAGSLVSAGIGLLVIGVSLYWQGPTWQWVPALAKTLGQPSTSAPELTARLAQNQALGLNQANRQYTTGLTRRARQAQTLLYSIFTSNETAQAGNWRDRIPWEGTQTLLHSALLFLRGVVSAWLGRPTGSAYAFDPDQPDLKALMRQQFLPDTAIATAFARRYGLSVQPVQVLPASRLQRAGFFLRSAYRERSATGEPTVYLPDAMLARLDQTPEQGRALAARLSRWAWLANRYFLGLMIRQQGAHYYADQRLRAARFRPAISDLEELETTTIAERDTGELVSDYYQDGRGKKGLGVYDILSLFESYWQEGQQVLYGPGQPENTLLNTFERARQQGADPTLPALATHLEQLPEAQLEKQGPLLVKRAVMNESRLLERTLRRRVTQDTLASVINSQIPGWKQIGRTPEIGVADATTEISVLNMPVAYASLLEQLRQMETQLRQANAPAGLLERIRILQQAMEEIQTAPAGTLAPLSPAVGQSLWGESAQQARLEQNQALTLGEDLDRQRLGATNRRAEITTLQGVPLAFRQVFEITSPEEQAAIRAWQQETALPDRAAARRYAGNRLRTITDTRTGTPLWLRAAKILSRLLPQPLSGRLQRGLQQALPLGMLQLVVERLPASPVKDLLADAQSPLGQAYLRWSAQPNRRTESRFVRALVRILKAQRQELLRLDAEPAWLESGRKAHVASLAAFMEMTRGLKSLQGVDVGSWDQVPVPGAKIRLLVPGILLRPGNLGVWGALSDILRDLPVTIDTDLFELQRRRLFRSATQAA